MSPLQNKSLFTKLSLLIFIKEYDIINYRIPERSGNVAKLKFTVKNGEVCIICKFTGCEMLNEVEYQYFIDNRIKGWLVPDAPSDDKLVFTGARGLPLINVLKNGIDKTYTSTYKKVSNINILLSNILILLLFEIIITLFIQNHF